MGDIYQMYELDEKKKSEGTPVDIGNGIRLIIARFGNDRFQSYWEKISQPHRRAIDTQTIDEKTFRALLIDALAETVLVGWEGVEVKGKKFPYSKSNAVRLLTDLEEVRNIVAEEARKLQNFRKALMEDDKGN